jgi:uncharacterized membrane protein
MYELAVSWDWLGFAVRWLHVITAIAWIGSSFYFVALDLGLRKRDRLPEGVFGEEWQVHGGGFYYIQKYIVAPEAMPEHLTWFKWESYATWLSGFALMVIIYYFGADLYLVDPEILDISPATAIAISIASIGAGWVAYDMICKSPIGRDNIRLMIVLYIVLVAVSWGYTQLFMGRAALLHLGAFAATIMSANVFLIIIPNQKIVVADLKAGRVPDPGLGLQAKQRSTHNNYLTLPVLFLMLCNHYPLAFATQFNWLIAALVIIIGVLIRHYFNSRHAGTGDPSWTWLASAVLFIVIVWLSTFPSSPVAEALDARTGTVIDGRANRFADASNFAEIRDTVQGRCAMCHSRQPVWEGMLVAPKGVYLETEADIAAHARTIYLQAGRSRAMPPANITGMEGKERAAIVRWYQQVTSGS